MNYVIFDLEWNGAFCRELDHYINEIIEIGAVKLDGSLRPVDTYQCLVRPVVARRITSPVRTLTSLTYDEVKRGKPFREAMKEFSAFCGDSVLMSWSRSDLDALADNIRFHEGELRLDFMKSYCDLQRYCQEMIGITRGNALGLRPALDLLGIEDDQEQSHRALGDSYVSALCLKRLYHPGALEYYTEKVDEEFYRRLDFKPYFIEGDLSDDELSLLTFNCPECAARSRSISTPRWNGKAYFVKLSCPRCGTRFTGRATLKQKWDSVNVGKRVFK